MILSRQNATVKHLKALSDKKERRKTMTYIVEGEKSVSAAIDAGADVKLVLCTLDLFDVYAGRGVKVVTAEKHIIDYCADSVTPQGVIAEVGVTYGEGLTGGSVVLLDGVSDPGNLGTIIRTCAAVGVKDIILVNCADVYSPKCVRSTMSGIFFVNPIICDAQTAFDITKAKRKIVADMNGVNVFSEKYENFSGDFCLIIGNEAHGVSDFFVKNADEVVSIPMKEQMESLNAGVSCSIILYRLLRNII